jgi:hypothetical protein
VDVTLSDLLWDGVEWVTHQGVADNGVRRIIQVAGINVTQDHLVLVRDEWVEAQHLRSELILKWAIETGTAHLPPEKWTVPMVPPIKWAERTSVYDLLNAGPRHRYTILTARGCLLVHNSGYRGGVSGYQTFARAYGVRLADHWGTIQERIDGKYIDKAEDSASQPWAQEQIKELGISPLEWIASETCKLAWRARHPATVRLWSDLQAAAITAIKNPGTQHRVGRLVVGMVKVKGFDWLLIKLASGRYLTYFKPQVHQGDFGETISYMSMASEVEGNTSRAWIRTYTHGGKLTGNVCQASARDLLLDSMPRVEAAGYRIVLSVHDELVTEAPDTSDYSSDDLSRILATNPPWADGLPLAAAGFESKRYKKED